MFPHFRPTARVLPLNEGISVSRYPVLSEACVPPVMLSPLHIRCFSSPILCHILGTLPT